MNVSEQLLKILTEEGVRHIFGVAGDALNPLVSAIAKQETVRWIRVKHEGNASYAAFAQGELTDHLGVCASTVGPGALHLVNGLYNAKRERSPVLAITGHIPVEQMRTNYFQEVNLEKVFDDICDFQAIIRSPQEAPRLVLKAIRIATNNKSVCRIELPADIAAMDAVKESIDSPVFRSCSSIVPPYENLKEAADLINMSDKIAILGGAGCRNARKDVVDFAAKIKAPITHTLRASDIFDHGTKNVVGLTGLIGNPSGYKAVMECDLLLMLGTDFPYSEFLPHNTKTIQVDIRPENIGNRTSVDIGIHGDIDPAISQLSRLCKEKEKNGFLEELERSFKNWKQKIRKKAKPDSGQKPMYPQAVTNKLSDIASEDAIFAIDTGTAAIWSSNHMNFHSERRIIGSFNHGSMAVGLPAAIGAQLQYPGREVWALVGDGAFNMALHEFSTAVNYDLPLKIIIFNNAELGLVKMEMEEAGFVPNFDALKVNNLNFSEFARLNGADGIKVNEAEDVFDALMTAKQSSKPFIVDASVTKGELSIPPHVSLKTAKNFGFSKIKEAIEVLKGNKDQWHNIKKEIEAYLNS